MPNEVPGVVTETWTYALVGGFVSMPLTLGRYWLSGMGNSFSLNMVFVGGLLAGYLAKRDSIDAEPVGLRAGVIGALPGLVWIFSPSLVTARSIAEAWSFAPAAAVLVVLFSLMALGIGAAGFFGGAVGGWLFEKIGDRTPEPGT
ncbi:DUF5518 domain-containing protein [Salinigranum marinum]|uniref:DUF5518 domain-containing protein n=1 Tax=Salinigranum marinum TaxID=1515595 RepID=UPI002989FA63|nr:DUF5518 domain-containing protein [Salinigranum marinum]